MKTCMEYRVEGRRPVGKQRRTWLESVEADMAELEIDKEVSNRLLPLDYSTPWWREMVL